LKNPHSFMMNVYISFGISLILIGVLTAAITALVQQCCGNGSTSSSKDSVGDSVDENEIDSSEIQQILKELKELSKDVDAMESSLKGTSKQDTTLATKLNDNFDESEHILDENDEGGADDVQDNDGEDTDSASMEETDASFPTAAELLERYQTSPYTQAWRQASGTVVS
jgi:TolA-binding protein